MKMNPFNDCFERALIYHESFFGTCLCHQLAMRPATVINLQTLWFAVCKRRPQHKYSVILKGALSFMMPQEQRVRASITHNFTVWIHLDILKVIELCYSLYSHLKLIKQRILITYIRLAC